MRDNKIHGYRALLITAISIKSRRTSIPIRNIPENVFKQMTGRTLSELGLMRTPDEFRCTSPKVDVRKIGKLEGSASLGKQVEELTERFEEFCNDHRELYEIRDPPKREKVRRSSCSAPELGLYDDMLAGVEVTEVSDMY